MKINIKTDKDFAKQMFKLRIKYGDDFEKLNGFHESQLNFSDFIDGFTAQNKVADVTIDSNASARHKDIRSMLSEKGKPHDKLFAFNKIFYELKKKYGLETAKEWLETEYNGGFYLHDAPSATYLPYCFSGDTKILTKDGIKRLDELEGKNISVLNKNHGWEDATVQSFGKQKLMRLNLERYGITKSIMVTANHKWFVNGYTENDLVTTENLRPGMRIPFNTSKTWSCINPSPFGIAHGFYTGDGDKGDKSRTNFCGDKKALLPYFTPANVTGTDNELTTYGIPSAFKALPSLTEDVGYLYGWLAGYFAADGSIDDKGRCTISSANLENLERVRDVLCVLGMPVNEIRYQDRVSNLTNEMGRVYILTLSAEYLKRDFFIRPTHIERFIEDQSRKNRSWIVKSVEPTDIEETVYCAVVEGTQSFTLDGNILTHNCYAYDLTKLATDGLFCLEHYNNQPAKHLTTFLDDVIEYISFMSNRSSGAVDIPNILIWTYYFWKHDCETGYCIKDPDYYIRQSFQKLIYRLNQPFMRIDQTAFVNVSIFDRNYIESLFGGVKYPDGTYVIDYVDELIEHQKIFMEVVSEIRNENLFTFPVLTYSLLYKDGKFVDEEFARWCSDHNTKWNDSNFFMSDDVTTLSNCCRLLSNTSKLNAFINSIGGTALSIGSVKVNTINLMRIAIESEGDEKQFLSILRKRTKLCCKTLDTVRHIIKRNVEKGLLPNYQDGAIEMDKQYCTIGILGLYEVIEAFGFVQTDEFGYKSYTDMGIAFASKIFDVLNEIKDSFTNDYSFNIESVPAERAAVILCQKDIQLYQGLKFNIRHPFKTLFPAFVGLRNKRAGEAATTLCDKFIYSNQWIPLSEKCTIKEKLRLSSILDKKCSGGSIAHINLESNFPNTEVAWQMLNRIAQSGVIYFAFNTRINECINHHGFVGTDICPTCGNPVYDTYQRIVGYLTPTRGYSKDRFREFNTRQWYDYAETLKE